MSSEERTYGRSGIVSTTEHTSAFADVETDMGGLEISDLVARVTDDGPATEKPFNPLEARLTGFIAVEYCNSHDTLAIKGDAADADSLAKRHPEAAVVSMKRARWVARELEGWDVAPKKELRWHAMAGNLQG